MMPLMECVPNFSEGRDEDLVRDLVSRIEGAGAEVLDWSMDPDHNRSVITFLGAPAAVEAAALAAAALAVERIDLNRHTGVHPRIGALDVLPFVPLSGVSMGDARASARRVARDIASRFGVPTYLYAAASDPPGRGLAELRRGGMERLREGYPVDRLPDFAATPGEGSAEGAAAGAELRPHPTAGTTCVGARPLLLAWNVEVSGVPMDDLRALAARLRETGGGFPGLRTLALHLDARGCAQLSMNLEDLGRTSPFEVFRAVESAVDALGGAVTATEVIGMLPDPLVLGAAEDRLGLVGSSPGRLLSNRVAIHAGARAARVAGELRALLAAGGVHLSEEARPELERLLAELGGGTPARD